MGKRKKKQKIYKKTQIKGLQSYLSNFSISPEIEAGFLTLEYLW